MVMDWWALLANTVRHIPIEKVLLPRRDPVAEAQKFLAGLQSSESQKEAPQRRSTEELSQVPEKVPPSAPTGVITREGVDTERMAWQDSTIRGELWLLEGHLKNNCVGCGGDVECCWKHCQNVIDAARETQSMTTDPLYQETVSLIESLQPLVLPTDVKAGKYVTYYPPMTVKVSKVRSQFDKKVMAHARAPVTLEQAKRIAAEEAAKEVERKWHSQKKK